jgi:subtilisin family serine protease
MGMMLLMAGYTMNTNAQVVNDDNEDGVVKLNANQSKYDYVQGQVLVKFKDENRVQVNAARGMFRSSSVSRLTQVLKKYGTEEMEQLLPNEKPNRSLSRSTAYSGETIQEKDLSQLYRVKLSEEHAQEALQLVDELKRLDEVEFAEPNYLLHTLDEVLVEGSPVQNPLFNNQNQWYLSEYGVTTLWNKKILFPTRPVIAIIDTGVDMTHPDLAPNLWTNPGEVNGEKGYDNDHNGFANDLHGWDFVNNTPNVRDFNMHGTHVAGIAAAANNNIGIVGANPRALIMPVSVMQSDGTGDVATIVKGINYAVANGATVLNLSLGTYANSRALRQALESAYTKAVIVAAAGNDHRCINRPHDPIPCNGAAPMFPAAYSFVLGVQATAQGGDLARFSNYDDDGKLFSTVTTLQDPDGFNYELKAPGTDMYSTIPGGSYKVLNGTSMAAPLVAGAISALTMVKDYRKEDGINQEILWGDLLHTNNIAEAYAITNRPAELDLQKILYREKEENTDEKEEDYGNDGRIDAGETVYLYPVIRTTFGKASNITMHLEMGDFEDSNTVEIVSDEEHKVNFGIPLDAYAKAVSLNPLVLKVAEGIANGRHIKMKVIITCDESNVIYVGNFTMVVDNIIKIGGAITSDITLTEDHEYAVYKTLLVTNGATLTIKPGVTLKFMDYAGISVDQGSHLVANGEPGKMITFTKNDGDIGYLSGIKQRSDETIEYAVFENFMYFNYSFGGLFSGTLNNCIIRNNFDGASSGGYPYIFSNVKLINSVCTENDFHCGMNAIGWENSNIVNNWGDNIYNKDYFTFSKNRDLSNCNVINLNYMNSQFYWSGQETGYYRNEYPNYYGSSREDIVRQGIWDVERGEGFMFWDPANMLTTPVAETHGIVWKVCVNGKDAQDEYEDLAPLGVGKHKFEVYFNRPMNKAVAPQISFGVRDPWTQNAVAEDGSWNEEGTIFTAYKTITGKTKSDGVNRIYVRKAEDNEYFECPYEKTRFNVMINAAGSMATGFAADAKMGRVDLTWNNEKNDFDDAMGFNIYRFSDSKLKTIPAHYDENNNWIEETQVPDTIRINQEIVDIATTEYTDYDVTPGETYYYMYKVLSTDLKEYDVSNVVVATPLTSQKGDANGDNTVSVNDVITTVNYILGENQKPFIFEAADYNSDNNIDVIDVIGIIQKALAPSNAREASIESVAEAVYTIENGVLYLETPVALGGLQIQASLTNNEKENSEKFAAAREMKGFEVASSWLTESDYRMLAYSFGSKILEPGKHAIMTIGDADITSIRLADTAGNSVMAVAGEATAIKDAMGSKVMTTKGVWNLSGQKVMGNSQNSQLKKGVYIIDGQKVVK